jgi:hypothetical protein
VVYRQRLQARRFELKYIVDPGRARAIGDFLRGHLVLDAHSRPGPDPAYRVCSLYLDSPRLELYQQTCQGLKNRFKLRMRFYDSDPSHPVFLEVKRRETDVICKQRAAVTRESAKLLLHGICPDASQLFDVSEDGKSRSALENFWRLCRQVEADTVAYVSYMREAYVSPTDDRLRVTFDRSLVGSLAEPQPALSVPRDGSGTDVGGVILEIKFTDSFPKWISQMVQLFDLERQSVPKYVHCVETLGLEKNRRLKSDREQVA